MPIAFLDKIRVAADKKLLFLPHAVNQMNRPERMISPSEIGRVIFEGSIIEDYPEDERGHSCLMMGKGENERPIHVVCAPKDEYLAIITAYIPSRDEWYSDWVTRVEK